MMRRIFEFLLLAMALAMTLFAADVPLVTGESDTFEKIMIQVWCDTASVHMSVDVSSYNYTLVHFPSEVDIFDSLLENATHVDVRTSTWDYTTHLYYEFDDTSLEEARAIADAITPSMSEAFGVSFTFSDSHVTDTTDAEVRYTAQYLDATSFSEWLISTCVTEDMNGLSDIIPGFVAKMSVAAQYVEIGVRASKREGGFNWETYVGVSAYNFGIPTGANSHTIDVLDLLGTSSLTPSAYSFDGSRYKSWISLSTMSSGSVSFVSCEPPLASVPGEKGWTNYTQILPGSIHAEFYFGSDPSPVTLVSITFDGIVIPEFTSLTLILTLMLAAASVFSLKKRLLQKKST